jgi:uncharacterized damage-inducible protein DinB
MSKPTNRSRIADVTRWLDPPKGGLWHGGPSPLSAVRGVSAEAAAWKPAPDRHSIWELTLHVAYWKYAVHRRLSGGPAGGFPRSPANWPGMPGQRDEAAWKRDRALLRDTHRALAEAIAGLDPGRLDDLDGRGGRWTLMDLVSGIVLHDTYHAGQIQLMKRLHRSMTA